MKRYIGTKIVDALPMTRGEYNVYRGWNMPANEDLSEDGYLVEYLDGGKPNCAGHAGYISWSPKDVFERSYHQLPFHVFHDPAAQCPSAVYPLPVSELHTIGWAIKQMQNGAKVSRAGWNGKGMFLFLVPGSTFKVSRAPLLGIYPEGTEINYRPHVDMRTADGKIVPWVCSQSDLLATDWELVE